MNPLLSGLYDGILRNMGLSKFAESREASLPSAQAEKLAVKPEVEGGSPPPPSVETAEILKVLAETEKDIDGYFSEATFGEGGRVTLGTCDWPDGEPDIPCCREKATHLLFDDSTDPVELCERHYKAYLWGKI